MDMIMKKEIFITDYLAEKIQYFKTHKTADAIFYEKACIGYLVEGSAEYICDGKKYHVSKGDLIYIPKKSKCISIWKGNPDIVFYSINFDFLYAKNMRLIDFQILKGIEIGMYEECHEPIRRTLEENSFDQVLASVHYIEQTDPYYGGYYEGKEWKEAYGRYLETIYREMTWLKDFDIMGHYDYIVRYASYPQTSIRYRDFSDLFDEMFRYLIHEGKALEINTKSYEGHRGRIVELDHDVLLRYREMGGEIISLGSDSHEPSRVGASFANHAALLKSLGFRWSAHYESRKLVQLPL